MLQTMIKPNPDKVRYAVRTGNPRLAVKTTRFTSGLNTTSWHF